MAADPSPTSVPPKREPLEKLLPLRLQTFILSK